jgi:hypothetical protein
VDAGIELKNINDSYTGNAPDLGAHELNTQLQLYGPIQGADTDGDGILDSNDNCTLVANVDQKDTDGDGFGNLCDADLDNNGTVSFNDLNIFRTHFGTSNADADFDSSGSVSFGDLEIFRNLFGLPPGPAGRL